MVYFLTPLKLFGDLPMNSMRQVRTCPLVAVALIAFECVRIDL